MLSPELSLCLIVKNEELHLRRCVESFGAIDDELILVDTGSMDRTVDIARDLLRHRNGRLAHFTWCDDFASARNFACSLASAPWILMVDADEYLSPNQHPRVVLEVIRRAPADILNVLLTDLTLHEGRVIFAHPVNRLFRNCPPVKWVGRIHESLTVTAAQQHLSTITLIHDNTGKRESDGRLRPEISLMYERGLVADVRATPESARPTFYLGNTLAERGEWAAALEAYQRYLDLAGPQGFMEERWQALQNIAMCRDRLGDTVGCRQALLQAVDVDPRRSESYLALGDCAMNVGKPDEARIWYQFAATLPAPTSTIFVDVHAYGFKPWWKLGSALIQQCDYASALATTERAFQLAPQEPEVHERLQHLKFALLEEAPVTVVVLSRTPELARCCLEGMLLNEGETYYETIIVCDGGIAPFEPLLEHFPRLRLENGQVPFIYARNVNIGIHACRGDVVLLNDDAIPQTRGWLDFLRSAALSRTDAGPVAPLLSHTSNPYQNASGFDSTTPTEAPFITFVCVYLRRALLDRVGPLDPGFVWYGWEDNDYCQRATSLGYKPLVTHQALVQHDHPSSSFSFPLLSNYFIQARHYFERKHMRSPSLYDVFVRIQRSSNQAIHALVRLLSVTPHDCRILVFYAGDDVSFADTLRGLEDPRLMLRFCPMMPDDVDILDELGSGSAQIVAEIDSHGLLPEGWLEAVLRARLTETPELGVLALPMRGSEPNPLTARRVRGIEIIPSSAEDIASAKTAVRAISRSLLDTFGPLRGSCVDVPAWHRLVHRLEQRGHVNGYVSPLVVAETMVVEDRN